MIRGSPSQAPAAYPSSASAATRRPAASPATTESSPPAPATATRSCRKRSRPIHPSRTAARVTITCRKESRGLPSSRGFFPSTSPSTPPVRATPQEFAVGKLQETGRQTGLRDRRPDGARLDTPLSAGRRPAGAAATHRAAEATAANRARVQRRLNPGPGTNPCRRAPRHGCVQL